MIFQVVIIKFLTIWFLTSSITLISFFENSKIKYINIVKRYNNTGKITCYHKGGGHKKAYRIINYKSKMNKSSNVIIHTIISYYSPNI
jgi:ribosomal protein L2